MTFDPSWISEEEVVKRNGSNPLSEDWNIGDKKGIILDHLKIQDSDGFSVIDTSGIAVINIEDEDGELSLKYGDGKINKISNDNTLSEDSDRTIVTEKAIKKYVYDIAHSSIFGSWYSWVDDISVSSTSSTIFTIKVRLSLPLIPEGYYRIGWYFEWQNSKTNADFFGQVLIDNLVDIANMNIQAKNNMSWYPVSGHAIVNLLSGSHVVDINYAAGSGSISYIRNTRLEFWRIA